MLRDMFGNAKITPDVEKSSVPPPSIEAVDKKTIYRNRYNYGVNLGSLFVLEKWIYNDLFDNVNSNNNEYDVISQRVKNFGKDDTARRLNEHYRNYINKINWVWLAGEVGVTVLRVPIGYWHVGNGRFVDDLPYAPLKGVYESAKPWDQLISLIGKARAYGIGILIDIHGLPGGANTGEHSGFKNDSVKFFSTSKYVQKMVKDVLPFIVNDVGKAYENVVGLQIVNEAIFDNNANDQKKYYQSAIKKIASIDNNFPVIISDGWWPQQVSDWLKQQNLDKNAIIDTHVYRCFSDADKSKTARQLIDSLPQTVNLPKNDADFLVGEFSCNLDEQTWNRSRDKDRQAYIKEFGLKQAQVFNSVSSWGYIFWTLQFQYGDGGAWGFVPLTNSGCIPKPLKRNMSNITENDIQRLVQAHKNYWKDKGGEKFEYWRFEDGVRKAVSDIKAFNGFNKSRVGRWHTWKAQRRREYVAEKGDSQYMWEWDQGFQEALDNFNL